MISVVIPTYNRKDELQKSLNSVRKQSIKDLEIIIVDDGSTDSTEEMIRQIDDKRIKYIKHKLNRGGNVARNTGIRYAHGDYIAFQDSDDIWHENKLEIEMQTLIDNNADVVYCKMNRIVNGKYAGKGYSYFSEGFIDCSGNLCGIGTQTLLGKAYVFKNCLFDSKLQRFQELELLIRLCELDFKIYCCDKVLVDYITNTNNEYISGNPHKLVTACKRIYKKHKYIYKEYSMTSRSISEFLFEQSFDNELSENEKNTLQQLVVCYHPSIKNIIRYFFIKTKNIFILKSFNGYGK